jgi:hypothetical protein
VTDDPAGKVSVSAGVKLKAGVLELNGNATRLVLEPPNSAIRKLVWVGSRANQNAKTRALGGEVAIEEANAPVAGSRLTPSIV